MIGTNGNRFRAPAARGTIEYIITPIIPAKTGLGIRHESRFADMMRWKGLYVEPTYSPFHRLIHRYDTHS